MHLDLMRDKHSALPDVATPAAVTSLRIWHCKYASLEDLHRFENLLELVIAGYPDGDLTALKGLRKLEYLSIVHLPAVSDLSPLAELGKLSSLSLATSPSWDAANKRTVVKTLEPLAELPLRHLELYGVVPADSDISCLQGCKTLQSARFSKYPKAQVEAFYRETGLKDDPIPRPKFELAAQASTS